MTNDFMPTKPTSKSSACCGSGKPIAWTAFILSSFALAGVIVLVANSSSAYPPTAEKISVSPSRAQVQNDQSGDIERMQKEISELQGVLGSHVFGERKYDVPVGKSVKSGANYLFGSPELGLSFEYPAAWGELNATKSNGSEFGLGSYNKPAGWYFVGHLQDNLTICGTSEDFSAPRSGGDCSITDLDVAKGEISFVWGTSSMPFTKEQIVDVQGGEGALLMPENLTEEQRRIVDSGDGPGLFVGIEAPMLYLKLKPSKDRDFKAALLLFDKGTPLVEIKKIIGTIKVY